MKLVRKLGVSSLSLLLFAIPVMACALPAVAMTAAERECCKHMAPDCGKRGMPQSHSCCGSAPVSDHLPAIKSSSDTSPNVVLALAHALAPASVLTPAEDFRFASRATDIHSPPVSPPVTISVLRI